MINLWFKVQIAYKSIDFFEKKLHAGARKYKLLVFFNLYSNFFVTARRICCSYYFCNYFEFLWMHGCLIFSASSWGNLQKVVGQVANDGMLAGT